MPIPSPFHSRTSVLNESHEWRDWSGYLAASLYEPQHEREYFAIRSSAAIIDVSPLFKYEIRGPDAERLLNRIMTRDVRKLQVGQVAYGPWCDDDGKVIDDGTIARLATDRFRVTAADPNLVWFQDCAMGMDVDIVDVSSSVAAVALQGPLSKAILMKVFPASRLEDLRYYRLAHATIQGIPLTITRTGYTGDLGYELWIDAEQASLLWDCIMEAGAAYGLLPAGMLALDGARVEAGLVMNGVDYISSRKALIASQKSSPFELGLGWAVHLEKESFIGRKALLAEKQRGSAWSLTGFQVSWDSLEKVFGSAGLAPQVAGRPSRLAVPVYQHGRQVGHASSHTFSPLLKSYLALATLESRCATPGEQVEYEITVEYQRLKAQASVTRLPFFNPSRKRA